MSRDAFDMYSEVSVKGNGHYFGDFFDGFQDLYLPYHPYASFLVGSFGIAVNAINIVVLTR